MNKIFLKTIVALLSLILSSMLSGSMLVLAQTLIGSPWMPNGPVTAIAKHGDLVYVAGGFTAVGRPLPNGVLFDKVNGAYNLNSSTPDGEVTSAQPDGNGGFLISGKFSHVGSTSRNGVAQINADGSVSSFNPLLPSGAKSVLAANSTVVVISAGPTLFGLSHAGTILWSLPAIGIVDALLRNSTLYILGGFSSVGGVARKNVAALDVETGTVLGWNIGNTISAGYSFAGLAASTSELFISPKFANANTFSVSLATGQLNSWTTNTIKGTMLVHNGRLYAQKSSGGLIIIDVQTKQVLSNPSISYPGSLVRIAADGNSIYLLGRQFKDSNNQPIGDAIAFDATTNALLPFKTTIFDNFYNQAAINTIAVSGNNVFIGGRYVGVGAENRSNVYSYSSVTGELTPFAPELGTPPTYIHATTSRLYVSGPFFSLAGQERNGVASFDIATSALTDWNPKWTYAPVPFGKLKGDDQTIYLMGEDLMDVDGHPRKGAAAFDAVTGALLDWSPSFNANELAFNENILVTAGYNVDSPGDRYQIHFFNRATGAEILPAISLRDESNNPGIIYNMIIGDNKLYVSGHFSVLKSGSTLVSRNALASVDLATGAINDWKPEGEFPECELSYNNGVVYVCGQFGMASGQTRLSIAALDGLTGQATNWYPVAESIKIINNSVQEVLATDDGVYLGGWFDFINKQPASFFAHVTGDNSNLITGRVFYDSNENGVMDPPELGAANILIEVQPGNIFYPTDHNGNYNAYVGPGNVTMRPIGPAYTTSVLPVQRTFSLASGSQTFIDNDFALRVQSGVADMNVALANNTAARPGFDVTYSLDYKNKGTLASNGTVSLILDNVLQFAGSSPAPSLINGNRYEWNYSNLSPSESRSVRLSLRLPPDVGLIGRVLHSSAAVTTLNDADATDNDFTLSQVVTGSYDPNDKLVTPVGYGPQGFIPQDISSLQYTIRFQNMGTDTAFNVVVKDRLDPTLDVSSFNMISASHSYSYTISNGEVVWQFNNIKLPHASINEPGSHGFITFNISPLNNHLPEGTTIQNNSDIYFDFNPPVQTNTVINTIKNPPYIPVEIKVANASGEKGDEVVVPITVKSFNNIVAAQFSLAWDPAVASFLQVEQLNSFIALGDFSTSQTNNGKLMLAWTDAALVARTLPDDAVLFAVRLALNGNYGLSTSLALTGNPTAIEFVDKDQHIVSALAQAGVVKILPTVMLSGLVTFPNDESIQNVTINITGAFIGSTTSVADGSYQLNLNATSPSDSYLITPTKDDPSPLNGVDVADVAAIQRHILQTQPFTSAFQTIAADVDDSRSVSVHDITLIKAVILGMGTGYPVNTFWRFVPDDYTFSSATNPFPFPQTTSMTAAQVQTAAANFRGIKLGDVNMTRDNTQSARAAGNEITFDIRREMDVNDPSDDGIIEIPIRVKKFDNISGYQFTMKWDPDKLELQKFDNQSVNSTFGTSQLSKGLLSVIWHNEEGTSTTLSDYSKLFMLNFKPTNNGGYKDISITDDLTAARVYDKNLRLISHGVSWSEATSEDYNEKTKVYPNPFSETLNIEFYSPEKEVVGLDITDILGRKVYQTSIIARKGMNKVQWNPTQGSGIYIANLHSARGEIKIKIVRNE